MKRTIILFLLCMAALAACSVDELNTAFSEPITDQNGVIIDHYPYLWARSHSADSAGTTARIEFKTPDCSLPMFDNGDKVIVGNVYGGITCLETNGGNVVWTCKLIDNPDVDTSKTIYDFHIASTEEWFIINLSGTRFVKIKLETGEILGLCEPQATASTRMIINGDVMFFININEQVYRVYIDDMECKPFSFFGVFVSTKKIYPFPCVINNEKCFFVQEIIERPSHLKRYVDMLYLMDSNYDTICKLEIKNYENKMDLVYLCDIAVYDNDVYLFTQNGLKIFNWDERKIIFQEKISKYPSYRYHEFYNDRLFCHFSNNNYNNDEVVFNMKTNEISGNMRHTCGSKIFDNVKYLPKGNFLRARDANTQQPLLFVRLIGTNYEPEPLSFHKYEAYENAIGKNAAGRTIVVFATDDLVYCYPGI